MQDPSGVEVWIECKGGRGLKRTDAAQRTIATAWDLYTEVRGGPLSTMAPQWLQTVRVPYPEYMVVTSAMPSAKSHAMTLLRKAQQEGWIGRIHTIDHLASSARNHEMFKNHWGVLSKQGKSGLHSIV